MKVVSPREIYIDFNRNFILDEKKPFFVNNLFDISDVKEMVDNQKKVVFSYFAFSTASNILKNNFVSIKDGDLFVNGKKYKKLLLDSGFFFDTTQESKENFLTKLNEIDIDNFVVVVNKKYHKVSCSNVYKTSNFKIIHKREKNSYILPAKCCHKNDNIELKLEQNTYLSKGDINVFFLDLNSTMKPLNTCSTDACKTLVSEIDNAKRTIDFAIYGFNNQPQIFSALINAKNRGVKIRWVTNYEDSENAYYPEIAKLKSVLPLYSSNKSTNENKKNGLMHNKFFVFDNEKVFTGSANITTTDLSGFNANYAVLITSKEIANIYKNEFEQMFNGKFSKAKKRQISNFIDLGNNTKITILFSPQDLIIDNYIVDLINMANNYIYIPAFLITDKNIQTALISAKHKGVDVRVINDATNAKSKYTVHKNLRANNIAVKTENYAGKMHMKSIVIDDKYSIIGSMNFTSSGNKRNDENVLIIESVEISKYLKKNFLYLWDKIQNKYLYYDPMAESLESIGSCFDGIDNDFDDKVDKKDEGCFIKQ